MSPARLPQLGSVVWAAVEDANGFRKVRPAVVVTATVDIVAGGTLRLLAITTRLPNPLPHDHVLLPWDAQGKARSGLRRQCAAVITWQAESSVDAVQEVAGILPPRVIEELLAKVVAAMPTPTDPSDAGSDKSPTDPSTGTEL